MKKIGNINFDFSKKENRVQILQKIIDTKNYRSYLEIGTFKNEVFDRIKCEKKIGVGPVMEGTIRKTSDDFFLNNKDKFDIIFIDGLHEYHQVKKDIENSFNSLNKEGIISIHDCLPVNYYAQAVPRCVYEWNEDVWKAFIEARTKENLDSFCFYADQGIGIIRKRKNKNKLLLNITDFSKIKYNYFFYNYKELMNLKEFNKILEII
jgi:predicted O-methyltransferase YrrM